MGTKGKSKYDGKYQLGHRFGNWILIDTSLQQVPNGKSKYPKIGFKVKCDCGTERIVDAWHLDSGTSTNCGCLYYQRGSANPNWRGIGEIPGRYIYRIEDSAKKREIEYNLTPELLWQQWQAQRGLCALTGAKLYFGTATSEMNSNASIDRIDSTKGYVSGNIQWTTKESNLAKQGMTLDEFTILCQEGLSMLEKLDVKNNKFVRGDIVRIIQFPDKEWKIDGWHGLDFGVYRWYEMRSTDGEKYARNIREDEIELIKKSELVDTSNGLQLYGIPIDKKIFPR